MKKSLSGLPLWNKYFTLKEQLALSVLTIAGLALRIINALQAPFWRDEAYIFFTSRYCSLMTLLLQRHWDTAHPPLYFLFLHFWAKVGNDPFLMRLPSLVTTIFILYAIPLVGILVWPTNKKFSFLLLFFYVFSHAQISLNMVARPYPFTILFILVSLGYFYQLRKKERFQKRDAVLFGVLNFFVFFADYSGVWLLLAYAAYIAGAFVLRRKVNPAIVKGLAITGFFCLLWFPVMLKNMPQSFHLERNLEKNFVNVNPLLSNLGEFGFFSSTTESDFPVKYEFFSNSSQLKWSLLITLVALAGLVFYCRRKKPNDPFPLLMFFAPLTGSFLFSLLIYPIFLSRNLFIVNIAEIFGLAAFFAILMEKRWYLTVLILIFYAFSFFLGFPYLHYVDKEMGYTKVIEAVKKDKVKQAHLVTLEPDFMFVSVYFYAEAGNMTGRLQTMPVKTLAEVKDNLYTSSAKTGDGVYFIQTYRYDQFDRSHEKYLSLSRKLHCTLEEIEVENLYFARCK